MANTNSKKVLIIQEVMKQYRLPFHQQLHNLCQEEHIAVKVIYSAADKSQKDKADNIDLPETLGQKVIKTTFLNKLIYQHCLSQIMQSDLIIVEQANRHLINYLLILLKFLTGKKFAFWGHGKNFQSDKMNFKEKLKRKIICTPDWWFAYTELSEKHVKNCGYPEGKITNVENSIDIKNLSQLIEDTSLQQTQNLRRQLAIPEPAKVGLYCGSMYPEKQLPFLLSSLPIIKAALPDFYFIFIGAGPDQHLVENFCHEHSWASYMGVAFDKDKAICYKITDIILNPGLVGLGILDSFAAGKPMITTSYPKHSPEISYLKPNSNGLILKEDVIEYSNAIIHLLTSPKELEKLQSGATESAKHYSIENMAMNFTNGISKALAS